MQHIEIAMPLVLMVAMLCQWVAWRVRLPAILFLLLAGLAAGPLTGWMNPDALLGDLLMPMVSMSVAIILFEGSLTLRIQEIAEVSRVVRRMVSIGALVTWVVVACAARLIFEFSWQVSTLFGAIMIVTGPTVIVPMLRSVRPISKLANILRWEGIAIDPIGALMAVLTYEFILASLEHDAMGHVLRVFFLSLLTGGLSGILAGVVLGQLLSRNWLPEYLQNLATLSLVLLSFSVSNMLQHESGLITVTIMGMWLANKREIDIHPILNFKEHLSLLLISMLFILLAARIDLQELTAIGGRAFILLLVLQFIARPLKVWVSCVGLNLNWREQGLLAWIAPRGIVAAAISAIFAEKLIAEGYSEANLLVPLTFFMIIGTVLWQSSTARLVARWLGVAEAKPRGFLIVGASAFSIALAKELIKHELRCVVVDTNWEKIRQARMEGLETFYGNPVSDHADVHLDLSGIGNLLALSRQRHLNMISAVHYRADFGTDRIFSLVSAIDSKQSDKHQVAGSYQGIKLFGDGATYFDLNTRMARGETIKSTTLSEEFTWETYRAKYGQSRLPLFLIDAKGIARPFNLEKPLTPDQGETVIALTVTGAESEHQA